MDTWIFKKQKYCLSPENDFSVSCILSPGSNSKVQIKPLFFVKWHFLHFKCFHSGNWTVKFSKIPKQCLCFLILFEINDLPGHKFSISSTSSSRVLQERFVSLLTLNLHQTPLSLAIEIAMDMARFRSSTSKCCTVGLASRGKKSERDRDKGTIRSVHALRLRGSFTLTGPAQVACVRPCSIWNNIEIEAIGFLNLRCSGRQIDLPSNFIGEILTLKTSFFSNVPVFGSAGLELWTWRQVEEMS